MSKWLDDHHAIALIRDPRKVSEAVAVKLLVEACAEGLVRAWQRACCEPKGFGLSIPAFVWRDAHFADGLLFEAGTDMYTHPGEEGGYGYGVNGIIEFNAEDLHYWLNVAPTPRRQRSAPNHTIARFERRAAPVETGIRLTPLKAGLFDRIKAAGDTRGWQSRIRYLSGRGVV
jgi:hypothetical protein